MTQGAWRLAPGARRLSRGRVAGGSPWRLVTLSPVGKGALDDLLGGTEPPRGSAEEELARRLARAGLLVGPPRAAAPAADVTVVVPARCTQQQLAGLLDRVPAELPLVVVDDGSPVPLAGVGDRTHLVELRHPAARGPAAARNAGVARARTAWVLFLDTDVRPPPDLAGRLLAAADPGVVAVAPRVLPAGDRGLAAWLEGAAPALDLGPVAADVAPGSRVPYVPSAALLVRREAFTAVAGFDEALRVGEDVDLVWRLREHGVVRYEPSVLVHHLPRASLGQVLGRRCAYGTSAAALDRRHPGQVRHADAWALSALPWALAVAGRPRLALAAGAAVLASGPLWLRGLPARESVALAGSAHLAGARALGRWLVRPALPLTVGLAVAVPRARPGLALAILLGRPRGRLLAQAADDAAYSAGVWAGCLRHRRVGPLLPRVRRPRVVRVTGHQR